MSNQDPKWPEDFEPRSTLASQIISGLLVVVVATGVIFATSEKGRQMAAQPTAERTTTGFGGVR